MVGKGVDVLVGTGTGEAGAEQDVNRMANRHKPEKERGILS